MASNSANSTNRVRSFSTSFVTKQRLLLKWMALDMSLGQIRSGMSDGMRGSPVVEFELSESGQSTSGTIWKVFWTISSMPAVIAQRAEEDPSTAFHAVPLPCDCRGG